MRQLATLSLLGFVMQATAQLTPTQPDLLAHVDPRIGVVGEGSTVIGPALPFGSVHPSPDTNDGGYDGYHPDRPIRGFSQTHVSGTGWGQYGNFLISPRVGLLATLPEQQDSPKADERAEAHQYQVRLTRDNIGVQFAPTHSAVIYRFTFPATEQAHIVLNSVHNIPGDIARMMFPQHTKPIATQLTLSEDGRSLSGHGDYTGGFSGRYRLHFHAEFDRAPRAYGTWRGEQIQAGERSLISDGKGERQHMGAYASFATQAGDVVQMKMAVSFHSVARAKTLLAMEIPGWDYDAVRDAGAASWRDTLSAFDIVGGTDAQRTIFYSAVHHAHLMPRQRTGEFTRFRADVPMWDDHYAVWDTWRTLYPLLALVRPDVVRDTVASFIERQRVDGTVPDTIVAGVNSFKEQGGNGVDMIIADAHAKQVPGIDWPAAYGVMKHNADKRRTGPNFDDPRKGPGPYRSTGWIPAGIMSTSMSLEYSYNDFVAAQVAASLGLGDDAKRYAERSRQWVNLWNPDAQDDGFKGFMMARKADGEWVDFDKKAYTGSWKPYLYESNVWTYSYFVPHQVQRLVDLMGGNEMFVKRLEYALEKNLIDLFNEPSFLVPQLFHYVGRPDLSAKWLKRITSERFTLTGYPGDDDSGAMSSYYIWAKLGLFPNAGQDVYYLNGTGFDRVTVRRPGHAPLQISRSGPGLYVADVKLDGKALQRSWLRHAELQAATTLEFSMSETPTRWAQQAPPPPSMP
jgi:predicted alpha-1,2-mannosidase